MWSLVLPIFEPRILLTYSFLPDFFHSTFVSFFYIAACSYTPFILTDTYYIPPCEYSFHSHWRILYSTVHVSILLLLSFRVVLCFVYWKQCCYKHSYTHLFRRLHKYTCLPRVELLGPMYTNVCSTVTDVSMHLSHIQMYLLGLCESQRQDCRALDLYHHWEAVHGVNRSCKKKKPLTLIRFCYFFK